MAGVAPQRLLQVMQDRARRSGEPYGPVMAEALEAPVILAGRYRVLAESQAASADDEAERVSASYGANYSRLQTLKQRFDPGNLFRMNLNIAPASTPRHWALA